MVAYGVVLVGVALVCGWSRLCHHWRSARSARHQRGEPMTGLAVADTYDNGGRRCLVTATTSVALEHRSLAQPDAYRFLSPRPGPCPGPRGRCPDVGRRCRTSPVATPSTIKITAGRCASCPQATALRGEHDEICQSRLFGQSWLFRLPPAPMVGLGAGPAPAPPTVGLARTAQPVLPPLATARGVEIHRDASQDRLRGCYGHAACGV